MANILIADLSKEFKLKTGEVSVFGQYKDQIMQILDLGDEGYTLFFILNDNDPQVIEKIGESEKFKELKLNKDFLVIDPGDNGTLLIYSNILYKNHEKQKEMIPQVINALTDELSKAQGSVEFKCDDCRKDISENILINNVVTQKCDNCLSSLKLKVEVEKRQFENLSPNYLVGSILGLAGSLLMGLVWIAIIIFANKDYLILTILMGIACGYMYKFGSKKIDNPGRALIFLLTLSGAFLSNVVAVMYYAYKGSGQIIFLESFNYYFANLTKTGLGDFFLAYLFPMIGAGYAVYTFKNDSVEFLVEKGEAYVS